MKIAVVGCGALGSVYSGLLADAGNAVLVPSYSPAETRRNVAVDRRIPAAVQHFAR